MVPIRFKMLYSMLSRDFLFELQNYHKKHITSIKVNRLFFLSWFRKTSGKPFLGKPEMLNMLIKIIQLLKYEECQADFSCTSSPDFAVLSSGNLVARDACWSILFSISGSYKIFSQRNSCVCCCSKYITPQIDFTTVFGF